ncbi:hypothetical protein HON22_01675, partial [Candidatus Peregrinibacteria bacterium]|nr:hypothetical protein [Candidatus Peregrinibacteria bacterium]
EKKIEKQLTCNVSEMLYGSYLINAYQAKIIGMLRGIDYLRSEWYNAIMVGCVEPITGLLENIAKEVNYMICIGKISNLKEERKNMINSLVQSIITDLTSVGNPHQISGKDVDSTTNKFEILKTELKIFLKSYHR